MSKLDYKTSGVDVGAGDSLVEWLQSEDSSSTKKAAPGRLRSGIGGFASLYDIRFPEMQRPLLITCTDGVGTKVKLASYFSDFSKVGQDLVAMCVNDLICTGGRPLQFLDYYATGKLNLADAKSFLQGIRKACIESDCLLVGGETAEMPGLYHGKDFDCAGFAVGVVDEERLWGAHRVQVGDILIGVASSGFHSNGYSLLRKIFAEDLEQFRDILMEPTRLYVQMTQALATEEIHAAAHITGGGVENIPRILPAFTEAKLRPWDLPEVYQEVQARTGLDFYELNQVLNCGLGFVLVVPASRAEALVKKINEDFFKAWIVGEVTPGESQEPCVAWESR